MSARELFGLATEQAHVIAKAKKQEMSGDYDKTIKAFFRGINTVMDRVQGIIKEGEMTPENLEIIQTITDKLNGVLADNEDSEEIEDEEDMD